MKRRSRNVGKNILYQTDLSGLQLFNKGKVRDIYAFDDSLLIIATDRISAFDVIMPNPIPGKGEILTRLSIFWFGKMADIIGQGCVAVHDAVTELRNMKNMRQITDALVAINSIENQGDDIFDMSIEKLFAEENDAKEVIKKREIYQVMEIVTDKCEDAANVIESIIVKYA